MHAFVERLCFHAGVVRVGPKAKKYGDPYDYAVAFRVKNPWRWFVFGQPGDAVIKGLVASSAKPLTYAHARAVIGALKDMGLTAVWERVREQG